MLNVILVYAICVVIEMIMLGYSNMSFKEAGLAIILAPLSVITTLIYFLLEGMIG